MSGISKRSRALVSSLNANLFSVILQGAGLFKDYQFPAERKKECLEISTKSMEGDSRKLAFNGVSRPIWMQAYLKFKGVIFAVPVIFLVGCSTATSAKNVTQSSQNINSNLSVLINTQSNLKVAEIPPTAARGQNYQYCYGCVAYNYKDFGTFDDSSDSNVSTEIMGAIKDQIGISQTQSNEFKTDIQFERQNADAPAFISQQTSLSVLKKGGN